MSYVFKPNSWIIRWAYFGEDPFSSWNRRDTRTSLCALFWRTVLLTPLKLFSLIGFVGVVGWGAWSLIPLLWTFTRHHWIDVVWTAVTALVIFGSAKFVYSHQAKMVTVEARLHQIGTFADVIFRGATAIKKKYCPIVTITRDPNGAVQKEWWD